MEIAERPMGPEASANTRDEVEDVLQRVREAVARTREAIAATQEMLGDRPASTAEDEAADP
jgi:gas vesicle protein